MTEQSSKKKKATVAAAVVTALALLFTGTFAWVSTAQSATNQFVKTDYQVVLHDKFDGVDVEDGKSHKVEFDAGDTVNKDIWVENAGSENILVRVKLTENMSIKQNSGAAQTIGTADAVHNLTDSATPTYGDDCADIHSHVTWISGNIITYDEWVARDGSTAGQEKMGAFWVVAPDGWAYWMQALEPSDPAVTGDSIQPGTSVGHTGLLLDAVKLNESETGHIDYTIKAEMDAIDAGLVGLTQDGTTWTGNEAQALAVYASNNGYTKAGVQARIEAEKANAEATALRQAADELASSSTATEEEKQAAVAAAEAAEKKAEYLAGAAEAGDAYLKAMNSGNNQEAYKQNGLMHAYSQAAETGGMVDTTRTDSAGTPYTTMTEADGTVHLVWMEVPADGVATIPDGIDIVGFELEEGNGGGGVFGRGNDKVKKIIVPEGVKVLGVDAFTELRNVESIELPSTLTKIGRWAISRLGANTEQGTDINIPNSVEVFERSAFSSSNFGDLTFSKGISPTTFSAILANFKARNIVIPEGITDLGTDNKSEFWCIEVSGNIVLPSTITYIKDYTFSGTKCNVLYVPDSMKERFATLSPHHSVPTFDFTVKFYTGSSEGGVQDSQVTSTVVYRDGAVVTE